ncbi:hypothetical protein V8G54_028560 [Vigna mungo]|uniref:Uncharacterized protein n=1 Tax=Vigna mungo TaxID=3915 RepID=A0AAQ3MT70_VIGMU
MPQRKPSPPESADMEGTAFVTEGRDGDVALLPQQMTSCFPLASIAQKTSSFANEADIGPMAPNPCAVAHQNKRMRERVGRFCMAGLGWEECHGLCEELLLLLFEIMTIKMVMLFVFAILAQVRTLRVRV